MYNINLLHFTLFLTSLKVLKAVSPSAYVSESKEKMANLKEHQHVVDQYKGIIQEQDQELTSTKQSLEMLQHQHTLAEKQLTELKDQVQQLRDQNALLKAQKGSGGDVKKDEEIKTLQAEIEMLRLQGSDKDSLVDRLKNELTISEAKVLAYISDGEEDKENNPSEVAVLQATVNRLNIDLQDTQKTLKDRDVEISRLQVLQTDTEKQIVILQTSVESNAGQDNSSSLRDELDKANNDKTALQERLTKSNEENLNLLDKLNKSKEEVKNIESTKQIVEEDLENLRKEQEDLLVLLADQDTKMDEYKKKLKDLGEQVEDDDEDDDDLGDDDLDEEEDD